MALSINTVIIAIMEYRENDYKLRGYRAHYATTKEIKYVSELLLDSLRGDCGLDIDLDNNIDFNLFTIRNDLIIPRENEHQTYEQIFKYFYSTCSSERIKKFVFDPYVIGTLLEAIKVINNDNTKNNEEGCEQHERKLQKVPNNF